MWGVKRGSPVAGKSDLRAEREFCTPSRLSSTVGAKGAELRDRWRCMRSVQERRHSCIVWSSLLSLSASRRWLAAVGAPSQRTVSAKVRDGKISLCSDRAFGGRAQVFVMNPNGTRQRRLTNLFSAKRGDFSSDGKRLVLDGRARETLYDFDVFVMNPGG